MTFLTRTTGRRVAAAALAALIAIATSGRPHAQSGPVALADEAFARATTIQATIYGYPLTGMYRRLTEEVLDPATRKAPFNAYFHYRMLSTPEVSPFPAPNNDTLYSTAWLDLREGPAILSMPATNGRYYTAHVLDLSTETIANFGQRLDGTEAATFAVVGPGWRGTLPPGIKRVVRSETSFAYVLLRILVDGPGDVSTVNQLQDQFRIAAPAAGAALVPPYVASTAAERLAMLSRVLSFSPVPERDAGIVATFAPLGVGPSEPTLKLSPTAALLDAAERDALALIASVGARTGSFVNGWRMPARAIGRYGTDYLQRASVWDGGPLANTVDESFYPAALLDSRNRPLDGATGRYVLRFPPGLRPPVRAFWSVTMYKLDDKNLVANPIRRYSIGNRTPGLVEAPGGSLSLFVQAEKPADPREVANWLPAPRQPFYLVLRLYGPGDDALSGAWQPPALIRID